MEQAIRLREQVQRSIEFHHFPVIADADSVVGEDGSESVSDAEHGTRCEGVTECSLDRSFCHVVDGS